MSYYSVSPQDLAATPAWEPKDGAPPLSPGEALEIARAAAADAQHPADLIVSSIELKPTCGPRKDHWYYVVGFEIASDRDAQISIVVLLDGRLLPAVKLTTDR